MIIDILVAVAAITFVVLVFGRIIYKKIKGTYKGECECCEKRMKKNIKNIKNELDKEFECCK